MSQTYKLEKMDAFFDKRADTYEHHMLVDLQLDEFYEAIDNCFAEAQVANLLDLGCGTGLELERFFRRFPQATVTGIDLSAGMLAQLQAKHPDKTMKLICDSYFDVNLGENSFECALSTYSFHHFSVEEKQGLYKKIRKALVSGGFFVLGDYTVATAERQQELWEEGQRLRQEQGADSGFYHFDTPFTVAAEIALLRAAGFATAELVRTWESTSIIVAQ